ncbi:MULTISPECIES: MFS transporter [unclassified Streptomyces]|uniref:MFS transporter n=1 Tax=unclassified Streptomyces TaxID=2593676 RepID=UPI002E2A7793|nr:MFS transporter [Streptomyces sp. NBC_00223]
MTTEQPVVHSLPSPAVAESPPFSARSAGMRIGALFGPAVFGVTAAGVALPKVSVALHATPAQAAWVLTAHALALGVGTALFGRLGDALGVRATLLVGSLVLLLGTGICVSAPNLGTLVAGRFVLAAGSGAMTSGALTLAASGDPAQRPKVLAGFGGTMAVFSASATLMGGVVTQWMTWRLTVVLPVLSLLAVPFCLPLATRPGSRKSIDVPGAALLTATVSALLVLIQSPTLSLSTPVVLTLVAIVVVAAAGLTARVRQSPEGFVQRSLATDGTFLLAGAIGIGVYAGLFAAMYAVPQILVKSYGWSVFQIGFALLPGAAIGAIVSRLAGKLTSGKGGNILLAGAAVASAVLIGIAGINGGGAWLLVSGASLGFAAFAVTQVVTTGLMSVRIPPQRRGGAMGLLNLTFFVGGGMGSGAAGALAKSMELTSALGLVAVLPLVSGLLALVLSNGRQKPAA